MVAQTKKKRYNNYRRGGNSTELKGHGWHKRFPLRGGNWNNTSSAGLGALNLNNVRANVNTNVGFRSALPLSQKAAVYGRPSSAEGKRSRVPSLWKRGENINRHGGLVDARFLTRRRMSPMPLSCGPHG
jgi:hypothetical protein